MTTAPGPPQQSQSLREVLRMYQVVQEALAGMDPAKAVPGTMLATHQCVARRCDFVTVFDKYFVCLNSCHVHVCTADTCDQLEETADGLICRISGFSFESRPLLVTSDFVTFGGQQTRTRINSDVCNADPAAAAAADATAGMDLVADEAGGGPDSVKLEELKDNPFDSRRERAFARTQREHVARRRECEVLLDLLLFSDHRRELNQWADRHTREKHAKGVANYMRSAQTKQVVFCHLLYIVTLDRMETAWCVEMPERDGPAHLDCVRVCEQACVWWNRFVADNGGKPLPNYTFKYHVLAVLYIYATGMFAHGTELLAASSLLRSTLPGVETLRDFPGMMSGYYTVHERTCRERILAWVAKHK